MTPIVTWTIWKAPNLTLIRVSGQWDHRAEPGSRSLPHGLDVHLCCYSFNVMRWNTLSARPMRNNQSVPPPPLPIKGNVALMLWYGEKSDLALGSGMFLVRLWWVGPGRGHMKGSFCQATKMFSLSLMKTRTHGLTWEHACHTLYKHCSYSPVDSRVFLSCSFTGWQSERLHTHVCVGRLRIWNNQDVEFKSQTHPETDR